MVDPLATGMAVGSGLKTPNFHFGLATVQASKVFGVWVGERKIVKIRARQAAWIEMGHCVAFLRRSSAPVFALRLDRSNVGNDIQ